ncbi:MAG: TonB-dependent receptor, partial [Flavisolibacter sp.]
MKKILLPIVLLLSLTSKSQYPDSLMVPVEVKAIRAGTMAPFAKTNLTKKDIARQNMGQDLPFILNQTPSVIVNSDAGNGIGYTGIRIRGTDATRINMTLNGIPYNDAESQGIFFVNLPDFASSVSSLQVQRGVGTSTNGPGAFGASINLSTNETNREAYAEVNNSYGSFNSWKNTVKAGSGLLGDHFTTDIRLSRITSDGYIDRASARLSSFYFSTAYVSADTELRLNIFSGNEKTYQAWNGVSESDLQTHRTINYAGMEKPGTPYENETDNYKQDHFQFFYNQKISDRLVFSNALFLVKGKGYYEQYKAGELYSDYGLQPRVIGAETIEETDLVRQLWLDNDYYGDVFSIQYQHEKTRLTAGGSVTRYTGHHIGKLIWAQKGLDEPGQQWYRLPAEKNDASFYGKWQQGLGSNWQLFTDLQYRMVDYRIRGFRENQALKINNRYGFWNPKLGFTFSKNNWTGYASYALANKEPNRDDFEAGMGEQPKRERLHDFELGLERKNSEATWSANLYYMKYRDQLVLTGRINDVGAYTRVNIPESYRMGIELQGNTIINKWLRAAGNLTLSRNRVNNLTEYIDDYDAGGQKLVEYKKSDIAFSPAVIGSVTISLLPFKGFQIDLPAKYVGKQFLDNTSNESRML